MSDNFSEKILFLSQKKNIPFLCLGKKGIEKENIRVDELGKIVSQEYPLAMGKALTHKHITKDYANAMLELVSPAFENTKKMFDFFFSLHCYIYKILPENLWIASCPPNLSQEIPIAEFGNSNKAKLKEYYRLGLKHRYGDDFQLFCGVHFNYSFHSKILNNLVQAGFFKDKNSAYFCVIRNFFRHEFILIFLFGASPFSFVEQNTIPHTTTFPYATSQRSQIYQNKVKLNVSSHSLQNYIADLLLATQTPDEQYQKIGQQNSQKYLQLNANQIQIENEFYNSIRPKAISQSSERPLSSLKKRGVEYLECRSLDLDPFSLMGIEESTAYFLEVFFYFCLLLPPSFIENEEAEQISQNNLQSALNGRKKNASFFYQKKKQEWCEIAKQIFPNLESIAKLLDVSSKSKNYKKAVEKQKKIFYNTDYALSTKFKKIIQQTSSQEYILQESKQRKKFFLKAHLEKKQENYFQKQAKESIIKWKAIEQSSLEYFDQFLSNYLTI